MNLAIFDIDGTLTQTDEIDEICFVQALSDAHAITGINTDWASYPHTTDSSITLTVFQERFNRAPDENDLAKFKTGFVNLLEDYCSNDSSLFSEIEGASQTLHRLNNEAEWRVAIASGSWAVSAAVKLRVAGIQLDDFPDAFADDGLSREEILKSAVSKAQFRYQQNHFARIVSVGDGVWDVRTARNLRFPFLGIGRDNRMKKLLQAGATHVIEDFSNYAEVICCLEEAGVPEAESQ
jgi:phosphoglycolate phosphatase-like HAD superfamily hydrolase